GPATNGTTDQNDPDKDKSVWSRLWSTVWPELSQGLASAAEEGEGFLSGLLRDLLKKSPALAKMVVETAALFFNETSKLLTGRDELKEIADKFAKDETTTANGSGATAHSSRDDDNRPQNQATTSANPQTHRVAEASVNTSSQITAANSFEQRGARLRLKMEMAA